MGNEFLNVAKRLEIKEISKDVDNDGSQSSQGQECNNKIEADNVQEETIVDSSNVAEEQQGCNILTNYKNEADQYPCNKCDKYYTDRSNLNKHIKRAHEGMRFPCDDCEYKSTTKQDLERHFQSVHQGMRYPCDICDYKATRRTNLYTHKKKHH